MGALSTIIPVIALVLTGSSETEAPRAIFGRSEGSFWTAARPDGHAPIGVSEDHAHGAGEAMIGLRYRTVEMRGLADGSTRVSPLQVLDTFQMAPQSMQMSMVGLGLMWAPADIVTLTAMISFTSTDMRSSTRTLALFDTEATGFGDARVSTIWRLWRFSRQQVLVNLGVSLPTGSIDETARTPMNPDALLPYSMQLGSGSYELLPGLTYVGQANDWSWGVQGLADFRLGKNERDWRRGHAVAVTGWFAYRFADWISASTRAAYDYSANVVGADPQLNPMMSPAADPQRQGGHRIVALLGANLYVAGGAFKDLRLAIEGGFAPFQSLNGPRLLVASVFVAGLQYGLSVY